MTTPVTLEPEALRTSMAAAGEDARPRPDCPPAESLWWAARAELDPETARGIVDHLSRCAACTEAWDLALELGRELGQPAGEPGPEDSAVRPSRSPEPLRVGVWWIAALLAVGLAGPLLLRSGEDTLRGERGSLRSALAPDRVLPRKDCRLRWAGPEGVESYAVELTWVTEENMGSLPGAPEIPAENSRGQFLIPESDLRGIPSGARLLFLVRALRGGDVIEEKTFTATIE